MERVSPRGGCIPHAYRDTPAVVHHLHVLRERDLEPERHVPSERLAEPDELPKARHAALVNPVDKIRRDLWIGVWVNHVLGLAPAEVSPLDPAGHVRYPERPYRLPERRLAEAPML